MERRRWTTWVLLTIVLTVLSGCAHVFVDADGRRHVIGFVALTLPAPEGRTGAETLRTRSLGVTLMRSPVGDALTVGWSDTSLTAVRDDSFVPMPPGPDR